MSTDICISLPMIGTFTFRPDESIKESLAKQSSEQQSRTLFNLERQIMAFLALECAGILAPYTGLSDEIDNLLAECSKRNGQRLAVCDF